MLSGRRHLALGTLLALLSVVVAHRSLCSLVFAAKVTPAHAYDGQLSQVSDFVYAFGNGKSANEPVLEHALGDMWKCNTSGF